MVQKKSNFKKPNLNTAEKSENPLNAYFLSLELENVRCFSEQQKIDFSDYHGKAKQWTIILGNNGTGKTTILQGLVAMLPIADLKKNCSPNYTTPGFSHKWSFIGRRYKKLKFSASFSVNYFQSENIWEHLEYNCEITPTEEIILGEFGSFPSQSFKSSFINKNIEINCFAYGAARKSNTKSNFEEKEFLPYQTLFDESASLINPEDWLLQAVHGISFAKLNNQPSYKRRNAVLEKIEEIIIKILPDIEEIRYGEKPSRGSIPSAIAEFHTPYGWVEARDLSLGYRTSMAWIVDFASRMFDLYPESENPLAESAVVLIDEIDLHLHPKWQRELLDYLSNLFPNTQFIVTTHSPLIVQSAVARDANIFVCRRKENNDYVVIDQITDALKNMRVDQILTAEYFNLPTARPKEIEPLLEEREKILSKAKLTKKDEKRLTELENEIGVMPVSENPEDDKAMDIIRRAAERLESQK